MKLITSAILRDFRSLSVEVYVKFQHDREVLYHIHKLGHLILGAIDWLTNHLAPLIPHPLLPDGQRRGETTEEVSMSLAVSGKRFM
jgi:hypothetical protein